MSSFCLQVRANSVTPTGRYRLISPSSISLDTALGAGGIIQGISSSATALNHRLKTGVPDEA
jgi:hypothetical protein